MNPVSRHRGGFRWERVAIERYKPEGERFRDVSRQMLFGEETGLGAELRYFEISPGGYTSLERHQHVHAVMIVRGHGRMLVGSEIHPVATFDLVHVPPQTWHQFRAPDDEPLGFLCLVEAARDRPQRPSAEQLAELRRRPEVAAFVRV